MTLNPAVILVGSNVSKHALDLFLKVFYLVLIVIHS